MKNTFPCAKQSHKLRNSINEIAISFVCLWVIGFGSFTHLLFATAGVANRSHFLNKAIIVSEGFLEDKSWNAEQVQQKYLYAEKIFIMKQCTL
jgi:hypothetical protein